MDIDVIGRYWADFRAFVLCERSALDACKMGWDSNSWANVKEQLALCNTGRAVFIDPPIRGEFICHFTSNDLPHDERRRVRFMEPRFWLDVRSGELLFGELRDGLPEDDQDDESEGQYLRSAIHIACTPGRYRVEVYNLLTPGTYAPEGAISYAVRLLPLAAGETAPQLERLPYDAWRLSRLSGR